MINTNEQKLPLDTEHNSNFVGRDFLASEKEIKSYLTTGSGFFYQAQLIEKVRSPYQLVSIWHTEDLGNTLVLDDQLMCGERDEHHYHEALIYPALIIKSSFVPTKNLNCLIIGGGDGGSCEELLKYPYIDNIDFVEIDEEVVRLSRQYLSAVHKNSYDNSKVNLKIEDGFSYLENTAKHYDIVYLDLNDPIGSNPVVKLYTPEFFTHLKKSLLPGGIAVMQVGAANYNEGFVKALQLAHNIFTSVGLYCAYCPSYHCLNYFVILSEYSDYLLKSLNKNQLAQRFFNLKNFETKIIDSDNFASLFSIAKEVKDNINKNLVISTDKEQAL